MPRASMGTNAPWFQMSAERPPPDLGRRTALVVGSAAAVIAALSISISNVALPTFYSNGGDVQAFLTGRYGVSFLLAAVLALIVHALQSRKANDVRWPSEAEVGAALLSGALYGAGALLVLGSIALIPVALAILILFTFPVLTVVFKAAIDRRPPELLQVVVLLIALGGVGLALDVQQGNLSVTGLVMASVGAILVAGTFVMNERLLPDVEPFAASAIMALSGLAIVAGFALATQSFSIPTGPGIPALAVAIAGSTVAFIGMFWAVKAIGATPTAMIMNLEPIFTIALSVWVLAEIPSLQRLAGAALVVGAVVASQWIASKSNASQQTVSHARSQSISSDPPYSADRRSSLR